MISINGDQINQVLRIYMLLSYLFINFRQLIRWIKEQYKILDNKSYRIKFRTEYIR